MDKIQDQNHSRPLASPSLANLPAELKLAILTVPMPRYRSYSLGRTCRAFWQVYQDNIDAIKRAEHFFYRLNDGSGWKPRSGRKAKHRPSTHAESTLELLRELPNVDGKTGQSKRKEGLLLVGLMRLVNTPGAPTMNLPSSLEFMPGRLMTMTLYKSGRIAFSEKED